VGADFPVFLHPQTHEEHALARTERKTGPGYRGFQFNADPGVTLEEDLLRRDLTINAIAQDESGALIDPFGGRRDLQARSCATSRRLSPKTPCASCVWPASPPAFPDFSVATETQALMRGMVEAGEVDALVSERIWREVSRGLMETRPSRMFEVLRGCGALARVLP
jgi:tRNA nucleotidyltransferase (CCA-adding enzyme)